MITFNAPPEMLKPPPKFFYGYVHEFRCSEKFHVQQCIYSQVQSGNILK